MSNLLLTAIAALASAALFKSGIADFSPITVTGNNNQITYVGHSPNATGSFGYKRVMEILEPMLNILNKTVSTVRSLTVQQRRAVPVLMGARNDELNEEAVVVKTGKERQKTYDELRTKVTSLSGVVENLNATILGIYAEFVKIQSAVNALSRDCKLESLNSSFMPNNTRAYNGLFVKPPV